MQTSICSLGKEKITICSALLLEVMAIHNDIFVEDIVLLRQDKERVLALNLPYKLEIKELALELPVFTQRHTRPKDFVPRVVDKSIIPAPPIRQALSKPALTPSQMARQEQESQEKITDPSKINTECYTAPMTISTMTHLMTKVRIALGWKCMWIAYSIRSPFNPFFFSFRLHHEVDAILLLL